VLFINMPGEIGSPPVVLRFESLRDLFRQYLELLVSARHRCPRGNQVVFEPYHFFHLVKLKKGFQTAFKISEERDAILATAKGFGEYEIDLARAEKLSWIPELIASPHEIYEYARKKTADEVFIREYERSGSPFKVLLLVREEDYLVPVTSMTVNRPGIKEHRKGVKLWPKT
jgi:hypothetical protein